MARDSYAHLYQKLDKILIMQRVDYKSSNNSPVNMVPKNPLKKEALTNLYCSGQDPNPINTRLILTMGVEL